MQGILLIVLTLYGFSDGALRNFILLKKHLSIGVILPPNTVTEVAFESALVRASMESKKYNYVMNIRYAPYGDSFAASKAACDLLASGVIAIYGPTDPYSADAVQAHCRAAGVPHIQASWRPPPIRGYEIPSPPGFNLYPEAVALSEAMAQFVKDSDWNTYTFLYDDDEGLIRLQEVLKYAPPTDKWLVRRLKRGEDNKQLLKSLKARGQTRVILDCPSDRVLQYLRQAHDVKFFEDYMSMYNVFFKEISKRLVDITGDRISGSYLGQRISLAIQRGNAASIFGTLPKGTPFNDIF